MINENGMTPIKLIFTVIILVAIIVCAVFVAKRLWDDNSVTDIKTDLLYVQAKTKGIHDKSLVDSNQQLLGEEINEFVDNKTIHDIVSQEDKWYKLSQDDLNQMGLGNLNAADGYIVNYETEEVIYVRGIEEDKQTYYKLSDVVEQEEQNEVKIEEQPVEEGTVSN